jgi:hypothetical protein
MFRTSLAAATLVVGIIACSDSSSPTALPALSKRPADLAANADRSGNADPRTVRMYDSCDPATFNAVFNDPTICIRQGHVPFDRFIAELTKTQQAAQWRFAPQQIELDRGDNLFAVNHGGEVHTFTRVANFGGGILPLLNDLSGNTAVAPECTTLEPDDFVARGATYTAELNINQVQHFQCCIHPWMRTDVRIKH